MLNENNLASLQEHEQTVSNYYDVQDPVNCKYFARRGSTCNIHAFRIVSGKSQQIIFLTVIFKKL